MTSSQLDATDRAIVGATEAGLPLVQQPYRAVAEIAGTSEADVRARLGRMLDAGVVRRIGAVPNHYALGLSVNAMTVWDVSDTALPRLGPAVGALEFVSHCYERPRRPPHWPFNLFAMVHGRSAAEVDGKIAAIADLLGPDCRARDVLVSRRILKKTGLRLAQQRE